MHTHLTCRMASTCIAIDLRYNRVSMLATILSAGMPAVSSTECVDARALMSA